MFTHMNFNGKGFIGASEAKTVNGTRIGTLRIASNESWKDKTTGEKRERTDWFTVKVFSSHLIDMIQNGWLTKGRYIEVSGDLRENRWTDQTGKDHFDVQMIAESINFLDRKPEDV